MSVEMTAPTTPELPVDSYKDAAPYLRRPFTPQAVKFKVQATWDGGALIVAYIDARLAIERLNLVVPHLWHDRYETVAKDCMWCHLTVDGITRSDVGEGSRKGLVSDALKRAAVHFGVGVSLYAIPKIILNLSDGHLKPNRKDKYELTDSGLVRCRQLYTAWLSGPGEAAFGKPLDHGDADEAIGDPEGVEPVAPPAEPINELRAAELHKIAGEAGITLPILAGWLRDNGYETPDLESDEDARAALQMLDAKAAAKYEADVATFKAKAAA